ncbi:MULTISPECIES: sigma-E factor negative regulatory protein [Pseudomonas]|uniref:sigma-E factor negative regulatory protein n=1 Tax=Pseudomonas TaxID=286 RepID=UPI00123969CC|nr:MULTISPECIES: sigma-E factor negative regulatory protein [Pseudomonas]QIB51108.1 sigma-E factor negative regulatory protein [Pseudomonas sp. OIL-1]
MRSESLQESLSAIMDGEAGELELRRVLQATEQEPAVRDTWERYQIARAAMHKEPWQGKVDLSAGIAAALANEPAPTASSQPSAIWQNMGKLAVAASVTLAVLVGVKMVNQDNVPGEPTIVAERPAQEAAPAPAAVPAARQSGSAVLAGFPASSDAAAPSDWHEQRISNYLRKHAEQGTQAATPSPVPYARAASLDDK